jgi:hypothetical protein
VVFAATILLLVGIYQIFLGIAAIAKNQFFVVTANYAYVVNVKTWGWIHLAIGIVAVLTGLFLFTGQLWARILGVAIAGISAVANFFFLPYYPLWSLLIIAVDVFAIWAIAHAGKADMLGTSEASAGYGSFAGEPEQAGQRWPSTNQAAGRHWAGEPAKEGAGNRAAAERQQAEAMAQPGGGQSYTTSQSYSGGQGGPTYTSEQRYTGGQGNQGGQGGQGNQGYSGGQGNQGYSGGQSSGGQSGQPSSGQQQPGMPRDPNYPPQSS